MTNRKNKRNLITKYLEKNTGFTITFIAKKYSISIGKLYNFCKGLSRNSDAEKIFLELGVPSNLIEQTFKKDDSNE